MGFNNRNGFSDSLKHFKLKGLLCVGSRPNNMMLLKFTLSKDILPLDGYILSGIWFNNAAWVVVTTLQTCICYFFRELYNLCVLLLLNYASVICMPWACFGLFRYAAVYVILYSPSFCLFVRFSYIICDIHGILYIFCYVCVLFFFF